MLKLAGSLLILFAAGDVSEVRDQLYVDGPDAHPRKHRLDLQLPKGKKDFPTVVFIHGGAWREGDRSLYGALGRRLAEDDVASATISYRLSPGVTHPEHARDSARAFAWVRSNIAAHGGNPDRLFVMGHSAGAHLAALLALDPKYLEEVKVPREAIRGTILVSGPYLIDAPPAKGPALRKLIVETFGDDPAAWRDASPITHLKNETSPFLVLTEMVDDQLMRASVELLQTAVKKTGARNFTFVDAKERNHISIVGRMMAVGADPYRLQVIAFIKERCAALDAVK